MRQIGGSWRRHRSVPTIFLKDCGNSNTARSTSPPISAVLSSIDSSFNLFLWHGQTRPDVFGRAENVRLLGRKSPATFAILQSSPYASLRSPHHLSLSLSLSVRSRTLSRPLLPLYCVLCTMRDCAVNCLSISRYCMEPRYVLLWVQYTDDDTWSPRIKRAWGAFAEDVERYFDGAMRVAKVSKTCLLFQTILSILHRGARYVPLKNIEEKYPASSVEP